MKHFLKGAAVVMAVIIVNMIVNIVCNMHGIDLNATGQSTVSAVCAMLIYRRLIINEKKKDDQD